MWLTQHWSDRRCLSKSRQSVIGYRWVLSFSHPSVRMLCFTILSWAPAQSFIRGSYHRSWLTGYRFQTSDAFFLLLTVFVFEHRSPWRCDTAWTAGLWNACAIACDHKMVSITSAFTLFTPPLLNKSTHAAPISAHENFSDLEEIFRLVGEAKCRMWSCVDLTFLHFICTCAHETGWWEEQHTDDNVADDNNTDDNTTTIMSDTSLTFICLVEGDPTERAFSVNIEPSDLVTVLKKHIKEEKANDFQQFDADELSLFVDGEMDTTYNDKPMLSNTAVELSPLYSVSRYFSSQPESGQVHIIVCPPPATFKPVAETSRLFRCQAYLKREKRSFFFEYIDQQEEPSDRWRQFQSLIKQAFGKFLHNTDSSVIHIQTIDGEIDISSGVELSYFMRENATSKELNFIVMTRKYFFY